MEFMTREVFDALIIGVILVGGTFAFLRLRADFTREIPAQDEDKKKKRPQWADDDTNPHMPNDDFEAGID